MKMGKIKRKGEKANEDSGERIRSESGRCSRGRKKKKRTNEYAGEKKAKRCTHTERESRQENE